MNCGSCEHRNPSAARFCEECGERIKSACSGCGTALSAQAKFCHECGRRTEGADAAVAPTPPAQTEPSRLADGRYELRRFIGEGAKKRVHLAYDSRLAREVALALIKVDGLDEAGRVRVLREAQAMGSLGDHPNIVTVHDIGEDGEQLFIVSQYMSGGDLESVLQGAGETRRLAAPEAVRIASQLCSALEHAHGHGVIHRDLKPGNIWLAADGTAKLGDFGLAVSTERTRLTQEGMMVGTVAYMAPEQALGRPPDASADLYALGATLYEMLTGRPPFLGDDAVAIISQHIHTPPVAPSWHNPEIPERLEALVLQLLEKDAQRRPESAAVVAERLGHVLAASAERAQASESESANPLDRLASGVFVGREQQLEQLRHGVDEALSGRGGVLLLVGEPGIGKTRTSEELVTYARMRGAQALWGRCYEGEGAPAYWPWMEIIRSYVHEREPKTLLSEMGSGAADIAEVVSDVRERLPGLPSPPALQPDEARFRLFDSITTFLKNASQQAPIVLVLDDLHWADRPSLLLLQFLARDIEGARILVLGTYRDVEVGRHHPLEETLAELARAQKGERVLLRGLGEDDVARFLELSSGHTPPPPMVDAVYRETEGNPFFVHEVVRLLQADGRLDHPEEVASWSVEIPQGVRQVVGRRLSALSEECNRVLTVASIIGREFELRVLAPVAEIGEDALLELLEEAEDARVISEAGSAPGRYRFSHALVRETLYDEVRTTRRVRLHQRIADVLEQRYGDAVESHLAELSYHYCEAALGGEVDKAIGYAERAARRALASLAFEEAADHFERALSALEANDVPDPLRRCQLLLSRGDALHGAGLPAESERVFRDGVALARELDAPEYLAIAVIGVMRLVVTLGTVEPDAVVLLEEALEKLGDDFPVLRARLLARLSGRLMWMGDLGRSRAVALQAVELGQGTEQLSALEELHQLDRALISDWLSRGVEPARIPTDRLLDLAVREGDRGAAFRAHVSLWRDHATVGERAAADRELRAQEELADELRQPRYRYESSRHLAGRALWEGRLADARSHAWDSRTAGLRSEPETALLSFGTQTYFLRRFQGRLAETEELLERGVEQYPDTILWAVLRTLMYAETGRVELAAEYLDRVVRSRFKPFETLPAVGAGLIALMLADAALPGQHVASAGRLYELLLPSEQRFVFIGGQGIVGSADRSLGNLAGLLERFDDAERHFEQALELETRFGACGWLPRTQSDYARVLLVRNAPGDRERALGLLDEAMTGSQELGLKGWLDRCIETKLAAQGVDSGATGATGTIDAVVGSLGNRAHDFSLHAGDDGTVSLMFSDVEGFTPMTERLGDVAARELIREHNGIVREQLAAHGGHEVEMQGDAFLLAFQSPRRALACAIAIQRALAARNKTAREAIRIRIGLHTGETLRDAERFFGLTVILAARIAALAQGAEILVSSQLREAAGNSAELRFGPEREVALKGISARQRIVSVEWE